MCVVRGARGLPRGAWLLTEVEKLEVTGCELVLDERALADLRQHRAGAQGGMQGGFVTTRMGLSSLRAIARDTAASRRLRLCSRSPSLWLRVCALTGQQESFEVGRR